MNGIYQFHSLFVKYIYIRFHIYCWFSCCFYCNPSCYFSCSWSLGYISCSYNLRCFYCVIWCLLYYRSCSWSLCYVSCSYSLRCSECIPSCFLCYLSCSPGVYVTLTAPQSETPLLYSQLLLWLDRHVKRCL